MLRALLSAVCVFALVGFVTAEEKKGTTTISGKFDSFKDGKLTILVIEKKGEDAKPQTFEIKDDIKTLVFTSGAEKPAEAVAKDAFKDLKSGTMVRVMIDADKKVTGIEVGTKPANMGYT
jgi:hypothetical protein